MGFCSSSRASVWSDGPNALATRAEARVLESSETAEKSLPSKGARSADRNGAVLSASSNPSRHITRGVTSGRVMSRTFSVVRWTSSTIRRSTDQPDHRAAGKVLLVDGSGALGHRIARLIRALPVARGTNP
jgi:hypothetical protein